MCYAVGVDRRNVRSSTLNAGQERFIPLNPRDGAERFRMSLVAFLNLILAVRKAVISGKWRVARREDRREKQIPRCARDDTGQGKENWKLEGRYQKEEKRN